MLMRSNPLSHFGCTIFVSACEGRMHHKGQEGSSRRLVWVEGLSVAGWGCAECAWVFTPSRSCLPTDKTFHELELVLQTQLFEDFASHTCTEHSRIKVATA